MKILTIAFLSLFSILHGAEKPNIIVILADDMGYGDCTAYNPESKIPTPNIDQLAREGMIFTDAHSASATCTASRYGLLTGITPARRGVVNGINSLGPVLEAKELTIAELLKAQGYSTKMVGKWHLGFELAPSEVRRPTIDLSKPFVGGPLDHGFDSFLGMNSAMSNGPYYYIRNRGPEVMPTESIPGTKAKDIDRRLTYAASDLAPGFVHKEVNSRLCDEVINIMTDHSAKGDPEPLFLYYAMLEPHTPWLPEDQFAGKSGAGPYGDYMVQLDHELGRVLKALKRPAMAVTPGSFRKDDWKLTFSRGPRSSGPEDREVANAELYHLPDDLGETSDLSQSEPERKAQLFAAYQEYFADAPMKPLAIQLQANKNKKAKPTRKTPAPTKAKPALSSHSTDAERKANYQKLRSENLQKQADLLTGEQRASSDAARKKAIAAGKKGVPLRKAIDAGANLTDEQKKKLEALRKEMSQLTREYRSGQQ